MMAVARSKPGRAHETALSQAVFGLRTMGVPDQNWAGRRKPESPVFAGVGAGVLPEAGAPGA